MYLKQIKIYGFKSFADKTEIDFGPNINGIVGPNGSGKSNIIDAVRWVLGEQSIKSLRGENSLDVIFSGSKSRKPLNSAYVSLVFDNSDKSIPIEYNEVSVKRVLYRSGENEYYLNNEKCRLKDITDILTETGASKESFNIISQGKIDEILSTKPQDRRVIFESAAGVLKYKRRKEEAIKKLDRTNANLDRVKDIINELESNLKPLERQCNDAKRYLEEKDKLKNIEISLIAYDVENYTYKINEYKESIDTLNLELSELYSNNSSYDVELLKEKDKLKNIDENISINQNKLLEYTKEIESIDSNIRILKERKKYAKSDTISNNIINLKEETLKLDNELNELNNNNLLNDKELTNINNNIDNLIGKLNILRKNYSDKENELNKNKRLITDTNYQIDVLENNINNNGSMPVSVKRIINNPRFSYVHNTIGNLIDIKEEYVDAVLTSLGQGVNYIVIDNSENAKELVNYLKDNNLGRATFLPLNVIKDRYIEDEILSRLKNIDSFINTLDNLVDYEEKYKNIIKNQMGNVIVCKDIDGANYISKIINHKYKIVTLDGQLINVGGSITGGSKVKINNNIKDKYDLEEKKKYIDNLSNKNKILNNDLFNINNEINILNTNINDKNIEKNKLESKIKIDREEYEKKLVLSNNLNRELKDLNSISNFTDDEEETKLLDSLYRARKEKDNVMSCIEELKLDKELLNKDIIEIEELSKNSNFNIQNKEKKLKELELLLNTSNLKIDNLLINLSNDYNMTFENAKLKYKLEMDIDEARSEVDRLKANLKSIDYVNLGAIEEYERVSERYNFLNNQKLDLEGAEDTLLEIINNMDSIMKEKFITTFEDIRKEFKIVFREMFGGGEAELSLTDPDNVLETGIEIKAVPSGKTMKSLSLLSGGEKTFTAISLLFAILNIKPVPFCLLDEVEAALDDANVDSFGNYLDKYRDVTQFILITHKKKTMEFANILYGITMQESGVSKLVSVKLEDIKKEKE